MSQKVPCHCGRVLVVPDRKAGGRVQCPKCRAEVQVPQATAVSAGPPPLAPRADDLPPDSATDSAPSAPGPSSTAPPKKSRPRDSAARDSAAAPPSDRAAAKATRVAPPAPPRRPTPTPPPAGRKQDADQAPAPGAESGAPKPAKTADASAKTSAPAKAPVMPPSVAPGGETRPRQPPPLPSPSAAEPASPPVLAAGTPQRTPPGEASAPAPAETAAPPKVPKSDSPRPAAIKPDVPAAPQPEVPNPSALKPDSPKPESPKPKALSDSPKPDSPKPGAPKPVAPETSTTSPEPRRSGASKQETRPDRPVAAPEAPVYELSAKTAETISTDAFELELKPSKPPAPPAAAAPPASAPPNVPAVEKIEPPPLPGERPSHGVEHSMDRRRMVLLLAGVLAAAGLFLAAPAAIKLFEQVRTGDPAIPRWVYALLLLGGLHLAYACYVAQIPDWSTVWVVAVAMLLCSGLNAVLLAAIWLGRQDGLLVGMLELHDQLPHGRASGWCFIMLCLSSLFAYFTGRMAARWQAADEIRWKALGNQ